MHVVYCSGKFLFVEINDQKPKFIGIKDMTERTTLNVSTDYYFVVVSVNTYFQADLIPPTKG